MLEPIPVSKRKPPENDTVILYCLDEDCFNCWAEEKGIIVGWWSGTRFHGLTGKKLPQQVTHWFPIPPYPEPCQPKGKTAFKKREGK